MTNIKDKTKPSDVQIILGRINKARKRAIKQTDEEWVKQDKLDFFEMVDKVAYISPTAAIKLLRIEEHKQETSPYGFSYTDDLAQSFYWEHTPDNIAYWSSIYSKL